MRALKTLSVLMLATLSFATMAHAGAGDEASQEANTQAAHDKKLFDDAAIYYKKNKAHFENTDYMAVIDYTLKSNQPRLYVVNLKNGEVDAYLTAHGKGSDKMATGHANHFSNEPSSLATSIGIFKTGSPTMGKCGLRLPIIGLSKTNSNAAIRGMGIGGSRYVDENTGRVGRSFGSIEVTASRSKELIRELKNGAMIYAYGEEKK